MPHNKSQKAGHTIPRNSKHIKTTPITAEQYLRDQLNWHAGDPLDKILKQTESLFPHNVQNNDEERRREETDMNNNSDTRTSSAQGHTLNNTQNNHKHKRVIKRASKNGHIDKSDENSNTQTCYGRVSRKPDGLTLNCMQTLCIYKVLSSDTQSMMEFIYEDMRLLEGRCDTGILPSPYFIN